MFDTPDNVSWKAFQDTFSKYIQPKPCSIEPITALDLQKQLNTMSPHRAVATDGWRAREMKDLPIPILELAAFLLNDIENGAPWPATCSLAIISCLPKTIPNTEPDDSEQISLIFAKSLGYTPNL